MKAFRATVALLLAVVPAPTAMAEQPAAPIAKAGLGDFLGNLLATAAGAAVQGAISSQLNRASAQPAPQYGGYQAYPQPQYPQQYPQQQDYSGGYQPASAYGQAAYGAAAPCYYAAAGGNLPALVQQQMMQAGCQVLQQGFDAVPQTVSEYLTPTTMPAQPLPQMGYYKTGEPTYQGVKVSAVILDGAGSVIGERPLIGSFRTGEHFRLKLHPTFAGLLEIDHIDPAGKRSRLFPAAGLEALLVKAGSEITVPMGNTAYEFDAETGDERLIVKIRDPRVTAPEMAGSSLVAEVVGQASFVGQSVPEGRYPYISQAFTIQHR